CARRSRNGKPNAPGERKTHFNRCQVARPLSSPVPGLAWYSVRNRSEFGEAFMCQRMPSRNWRAVSSRKKDPLTQADRARPALWLSSSEQKEVTRRLNRAYPAEAEHPRDGRCWQSADTLTA